MRLGTFLHIVIWPSLGVLGGLLLLAPRDILRQPILQSADSPRVVATADAAEILPATLTVRATALPPGAGVPRRQLAATEAPVTSAPEAPAAPAPVVDRRWITAGALNLRSGPSVNAELIASLPLGTPVDVIEISGNWARVTSDGAEGWLSTRFLGADAPD